MQVRARRGQRAAASARVRAAAAHPQAGAAAHPQAGAAAHRRRGRRGGRGAEEAAGTGAGAGAGRRCRRGRSCRGRSRLGGRGCRLRRTRCHWKAKAPTQSRSYRPFARASGSSPRQLATTLGAKTTSKHTLILQWLTGVPLPPLPPLPAPASASESAPPSASAPPAPPGIAAAPPLPPAGPLAGRPSPPVPAPPATPPLPPADMTKPPPLLSVPPPPRFTSSPPEVAPPVVGAAPGEGGSALPLPVEPALPLLGAGGGGAPQKGRPGWGLMQGPGVVSLLHAPMTASADASDSARERRLPPIVWSRNARQPITRTGYGKSVAASLALIRILARACIFAVLVACTSPPLQQHEPPSGARGFTEAHRRPAHAPHVTSAARCRGARCGRRRAAERP